MCEHTRSSFSSTQRGLHVVHADLQHPGDLINLVPFIVGHVEKGTALDRCQQGVPPIRFVAGHISSRGDDPVRRSGAGCIPPLAVSAICSAATGASSSLIVLDNSRSAFQSEAADPSSRCTSWGATSATNGEAISRAFLELYFWRSAGAKTCLTLPPACRPPAICNSTGAPVAPGIAGCSSGRRRPPATCSPSHLCWQFGACQRV